MKRNDKKLILSGRKVEIENVWQDPANARKHDKRNIDAIAGSLRRFGQQKPIIVRADGMILAGNGTHQAAQQIGWKHVWAEITTLEDAEGTAYALADNRIAELAEWEMEALASTLHRLQEAEISIDDLGWADFELEPILMVEWNPPTIGELPGESNVNKITSIIVTSDQRQTIDRAIARFREINEDGQIKEGRCIELICADWLSGN